MLLEVYFYLSDFNWYNRILESESVKCLMLQTINLTHTSELAFFLERDIFRNDENLY